MHADLKENPRTFEVRGYQIKDFGKLQLDTGEMVSFVTKEGRECDVTAMEWGFYLGSSLNSRLRGQGFKVALVLNEQGRLYVNAVEENKIDIFKKYLKTNQNIRVLCWLDEWLENEGIS